MPSFDFGMPVPSTSAISIPEQLTIVDHAESLGYDALFVAESWGREAFTRLGLFGEHTESIRLGTGIVPVHSRSPTLLAQAIATLDEITDGRAFLGLGLSSPAVIESWHGIDFEPALRRQRETIEIINQALSGDPVEYPGSVFDLEHFHLRFDPPRDDLPIYVAAQGPTNCKLVGEYADGWLPNRIPVSRLSSVREYIQDGARERNRSPSAIQTIPYVTSCVLDDGNRARNRCRDAIAFYVGAMGSYHFEAVARNGYRPEAETIQAHWQAGDHTKARAAVTDELLDEITLSGTPEEVEPILNNYEDIAEMVVTLPPSTASLDEITTTMEYIKSL